MVGDLLIEVLIVRGRPALICRLSELRGNNHASTFLWLIAVVSHSQFKVLREILYLFEIISKNTESNIEACFIGNGSISINNLLDWCYNILFAEIVRYTALVKHSVKSIK